MKNRVVQMIIMLAMIMWLCLVSRAHAAGLLKPVGSNNSVGIKSHAVKVTINNGFARTEVDQVFYNSADHDLNAIYTFPLPQKSSLSEVSLWIDGQEVIGEVLEKERARKVHDKQKKQGKDTALAEQDEYKAYTIEVSPVRSQQETRVRLVYYQPLTIDLNVGRYVYPLAEGGVDEERIAFWSVDEAVTGTFSFDLELKSAFPIADVRMPVYEQDALIEKKIRNEDQSGDIYTVSLTYGESARLNKDVVFYYRLSDDVPARIGLVPYRESPQSDGTFMTVITPAASLQRISEGTDWVFILDTSGSMSGHKIATLCGGVSQVLGRMSAQDRFRIITFSDNAADITHGYIHATPENIQQWLERVMQIQADGSTNLFAGLDMGYKYLDEDRTTGMVLVTDGVANTGPTHERDFLRLTEKNDLRLFTFVIGNSANQPLLEKLAKRSGGFAMNISSSDDISGRLLQAKAKVLHECLHDVRLKFAGEKVYDVYPTELGNIYIGEQIVVFGKYRGSGPARVEMHAKVSGADKVWACEVDLPEIDADNPEIERLWALAKVDGAMQQIREHGENKKLRKTVVDTGLEYSLVTEYTSMLVISDAEWEALGIQRRNATRVQKERAAQQRRKQAAIRNHTSKSASANNMFNGLKAPNIGTGPIGPLSLFSAIWMARRKRKQRS